MLRTHPAAQKILQDWRRWIYPLTLVTIYTIYLAYMFLADRWGIFHDNWEAALTMVGGSFVAGSTAEGGAAVAFPVFTKVLHIPATDARTFGLMIQTFGMSMASVMILAQGIQFLGKVVAWVSLGGVLGQIIGTFVVTMPDPYPRILFTAIAAAFGIAMIISRWVIGWDPRTTVRGWKKTHKQQARFFVIGIAGGWFAAHTGSGIDMLTFIVLTLAFGVNEKISTPTTVMIMAINSAVGSFLHVGIKGDIGIVWDYWLAAVPVVVIGAPLGAVASAHLKRDHIIYFVLFLISLEVVTTILLVHFTGENIAITAVIMVLFSIWFAMLLRFRHKNIAPLTRTVVLRARDIPESEW